MNHIDHAKKIIQMIEELYPQYTINAESMPINGSLYIKAVYKKYWYRIGNDELYPIGFLVRISDHGGSWMYAGQDRIEIDAKKKLPKNVKILIKNEVEKNIKKVQIDNPMYPFLVQEFNKEFNFL